MFRISAVFLFVLIISCKPHLPAYKILHKTEYNYSLPINVSDQIIRLHTFKNDERIVSCSLVTEGVNYTITDESDKYNNQAWLIHLRDKTDYLRITSCLVLDTARLFKHEYKYSLSSYLDSESSFLDTDSFGAPMYAFIKVYPIRQLADEQDLLLACNNVFHQFTYGIHIEPGIYSTSELLERKVGSCRDMTWFLIQYLRSQQIKARVVSGYLVNWVDKKAEFHSWAEAKSSEGKWLGLDPTSGLAITSFHIPLAVGENFDDVLPIYGFHDSCSVKASYELKLMMK